jgi:hypothetical protein
MTKIPHLNIWHRWRVSNGRAGPVLAARSRLPSAGGTREDAPVEVLETRARRRPKALRHWPTSEAIIAMLLELPRP